ncbi:hypothetical protein EJ02DRAFT_460470 [Clathrospora elynae]|uniref:Uncharacterized protein n=1 Tax=Clathrospora elynae TaxID=706981 RepID=A0A6A5S3X2_9PLEO|nr:hypothetical protein EJ02DRAFT_460470 [Clathrospora elynae]
MGFPRTSCQTALNRQKSREDLKRKLDNIDAQDSDNSYDLWVSLPCQHSCLSLVLTQLL